jgi:hypothetical protein
MYKQPSHLLIYDCFYIACLSGDNYPTNFDEGYVLIKHPADHKRCAFLKRWQFYDMFTVCYRLTAF